MVKNVFNLVNHKLEEKKQYLRGIQSELQAIIDNDINSSCFEQNAMNRLIILSELKAEIRELEYLREMIGGSSYDA